MTPPLRTCLGCRRRQAKAELVRLAWDGAAGAVVVDTLQVLPGRGCYVHPGCAATTARRRVIGRALRRTVDGDQVAGLLAAVAADQSA
ncbi:MAG: YlxR family protein [Propionicimonas sp.]